MKELRPILTLLAIFTLLLGLAYPLAITGIGQVLFPSEASGSLVERNGQISGSTLIAQGFTRPEYFHPRPSAAGNGYDAANSSGSNLAPSNKKLVEGISGRASDASNGANGVRVPADLVTASGSGLDPHISPESAALQVPRVATARGLPEARVRDIVAANTEGMTFGVLGKPRVNVLQLNLALDAEETSPQPR